MMTMMMMIMMVIKMILMTMMMMIMKEGRQPFTSPTFQVLHVAIQATDATAKF